MFRLIMMRFLETYLRHRFLWFLPVVGMVIFAAINFLTTKPTYVSLAALYINQETLLNDIASLNQGGFSWVTPAQATTNQMKELMQTDSFIRSVIQKSDLETDIAKDPTKTNELIVQSRSSMWVNTLGDNTIVVGASNDVPLISQQIAQGIVEVFLQWKINTGHQATTTAVSFYDDLVTTYTGQMQSAKDELQKYLDAHPSPITGDRPASETVEINRLENQLSTVTTRLTKAQDDLESSSLTEKINESEVRQKYLIVDSPNLPNKPALSNTKKLTNAAVYLVIGLVLSIIAIIIGAIRDSTFRFLEDVTFQLELPVYAIIYDWNYAGGKKAKKKDKHKDKSKPEDEKGLNPDLETPAQDPAETGDIALTRGGSGPDSEPPGQEKL